MTIGTPTNAERAGLAEHALYAFSELTNEPPSVDTITDLLADLMHYCRENNTDFSFDECLESARMHFAAETSEEAK